MKEELLSFEVNTKFDIVFRAGYQGNVDFGKWKDSCF